MGYLTQHSKFGRFLTTRLVTPVLTAVVALVVGYQFGIAVTPIPTLLESKPHEPTAFVVAECDVWHIKQQSPTGYWDNDNTESASTADYYTVTPGHPPPDTPHYLPDEWAVLSPTDTHSFIITYWDTDNPFDPQPLTQYGINVRRSLCP